MERKTNNNILVPTDFSEVAENALQNAIQVAKVYKNEITLLYILEESFLGGIFSKTQSDVMRDAILTKLKVKADEITAQHHVKVSVRVESGKVYKTIATVANEEKFDSIIMGSHGASGLEQIVGSNASRTIQYAEVPVVVVPAENKGSKGYKKIVMPFDLTLETRQKVEWGIHIAKKFDSEIHLVYSKTDDEYLDIKMKANIASVEHTLKGANVSYTLYELKDSVLDNFATEIHNYANIVSADLIVAMTHTEKGISEVLIGTLTQQLVNKASKVAVMCIHPRETGFTYDY